MAQSLQAGAGQLFPASWAPPQRQLDPPAAAGPVPVPEGGVRPLFSGCLFGLSVSRAQGLCNRPARHFCERSHPCQVSAAEFRTAPARGSRTETRPARETEAQVGAMARTGPRLALLLLLLGALLLAGPGRAQRETRHEKFHRQHVDHPRTSAPDTRRYCNQLMAQRKMTGAACKPTNTFLHAPPAQVDGICGPGGTPGTGNYHDSLEPLELTVCRLAGDSPRPPCSYRGRTGTHHVRLACEGGLPVHFQRQL